MKVRVSFRACAEIEVDDKYKTLDLPEEYDQDYKLVWKLEEECKRQIHRMFDNSVDVYDFNFCEASESGNVLWDY